MKRLRLILGILTGSLYLIPASTAQNIAYIYGDVASDGDIPSGNASPFHQMLLTDTGNRGCSFFKAMVEGEGYTITQHYDQQTTIDPDFLDSYQVIVFGLHQKIWSNSEKTALDEWIHSGGGILMYSDSAAGGLHSSVGIKNATGQAAVNNVLSAYDMEVTVDQGQGTRAYTSIDNDSHPLTMGSLEFEGEGVSPVAVDESRGAVALYPLEAAYQISGGSLGIDTRNISISNPRWAAIGLQTVGKGNVIASFDRQPIWNNGEGSDIEKRDNEEVLRRIINYLADPPTPIDPTSLLYLDSVVTMDPTDQLHYLDLSYRQWTGGNGTDGVNYTSGGHVFRLQSHSSLDEGLWTSGPLVTQQLTTNVDHGDGSETVTLRLRPAIESQGQNFARLAILEASDQLLRANAGPDQLINQTGTAQLQGQLTGEAIRKVEWRQHTGPGTAIFADSSSAETTASFSAAGVYQLFLLAENEHERTSDLIEITVADPSKVALAINCGGQAILGTNGFSYQADAYFSGGHVDAFPGNPVNGTLDDLLYNYARSAHSAYNFPLAAGDYLIHLQFTETFFNEPGKRVFDLAINDSQVIEDLDLYATAPGKWVAHNRNFDAASQSGALRLSFSASANNPLISAIVIIAR